MSLYLLPISVVENLDKQRRTFFWQGGRVKRKYHLVKWGILCKSKKKGGLGIKDIRKINLSLLCKWWWKLEKEEEIWQTIVRNKYLKNGMVSTVKTKWDDSPVWKDLMKVKHIYMAGRKIELQNGENMRFWQDSWLGDQPICAKFPILYELSEVKNISVGEFIRKNGLITFRRWLLTILQEQWEVLKQHALATPLSQNQDKVSWKWSQKGIFSVKSTYDRLTSNDNGDSFSRIWKAKLPYKIKIFLWLIEQGAILTKDNMVRRRWPGNPSCCFCDNLESINHLFFSCPTAKVIWSIVAKSIGATNVPNSVAQFWNWCRHWIPASTQIHAYVLAAIC